MPGEGFGVVPTDIAAKKLSEKLPDAVELIIAYVTMGGASRGTLKSVLKNIHLPGVKIINEKPEKAMPAETDFFFETDGKKYLVVYNPWRADLFTAGISTGIPNIKAYSSFPGIVEKMMQGKCLTLRDFLLNKLIKFLPVGPSEKAMQKGKTIVYAEVRNARGKSEKCRNQGPEAYAFTTRPLINISIQVCRNHFMPGF